MKSNYYPISLFIVILLVNFISWIVTLLKRSLKNFLSTKTITYIKYIPISIARVKNWYPFLLNYIGLKNEDIDRIYQLRNGTKFQVHYSLDAATIFVIYIRRDYGKMPDNSIIVDIGANIGVYSVYSSLQGKNNLVYAYEPIKETFDHLAENIKINDCQDKIIPFNYGIASKKEKRKMYLVDSVNNTIIESNSDLPSVEVETITLEDIFVDNSLDKIDLLKLDCEGAEYEIFYNLPDQYFPKIKEIRMEFHGLEKGKELRAFLETKGFKINKFKKGNLWAVYTE